MWYAAIALVLTIGFLFGFRNRLYSGYLSPELINDGAQPAPANVAEENGDTVWTKKDIEIKLRKLANSPAPTILSFGAMCYKPALPPDTATYICPGCGERTFYKFDNFDGWGIIRNIQWDINYCRELAKKIQGVNIIVDESQFCKHCSPGVETPELCLLVNFAGSADTTRTCGVKPGDLRLINEFLSGSDRHIEGNDAETPLVNYFSRLEQLLGVKITQKDDE